MKVLGLRFQFSLAEHEFLVLHGTVWGFSRALFSLQKARGIEQQMMLARKL